MSGPDEQVDLQDPGLAVDAGGRSLKVPGLQNVSATVLLGKSLLPSQMGQLSKRIFACLYFFIGGRFDWIHFIRVNFIGGTISRMRKRSFG